METISRPNRFLLRSHDVVQVLTASCRFFVDVVGTWPGVRGLKVLRDVVRGLLICPSNR